MDEESDVPFTTTSGKEVALKAKRGRPKASSKKKVIETVSPGDLGVDIGESGIKIHAHDSPPEKPPGQKFEGAESVPTVVAKLREEANVI